MDRHYSVLEKATNSPIKMGSNNGYIGGAFGICNGAANGVIMSSSGKFGKQQMLNGHPIVVSPESETPSPPQQHGVVSTSTNHISSSLNSCSPLINPKDVATAMSARNGHVKNCSSMDHHPAAYAARNVMRPDIHSAAVQSPHHHHNHFHSSSLHQHPIVSGNTMGGVVVDGDYAVENQMFRAPTMGGPGGMPSHSYVTSSGEPIAAPDSSPPDNSAYGEMGGKSFGRKRSRKRPKTCGVCGDRAKSFHFGGLSCDSCKAFFRRSVQNDAHVAFRCAYDSCCDINISTRKSCQFCRFKKCISIGMEKSWVMTEEERNALNQQRLEKKQQNNKSTTSTTAAPSNPPNNIQSQQLQIQQQHELQQQLPRLSPSASSTSSLSQDPIYTFQTSGNAMVANAKEPSALAFQESEYVADVDKMLDYMTADEQLEIKTVVETYLHAYKEMPFRVSFEEGRRDTLEIIEMFTTILRRFAYFAKLIPDFSALDRADQGNLLRAAVLEMCLLRGAACFDTQTNRWPSSTMESLKDCPQLRVEDMQRLVSRELFEMHITFILHMKRLRIDEPIAMLLIMTVLFSPERVPVENKVKVNQSQEKYLMLLKKYVIWKFGATAGSRVYPQLLTKLSDLRQLNDFHTEFHLNLDSKEVNAIKKSLEELHLNPYPNWKIVPESQGSSEDPRTSDTSSATPSPAGSMSMPGNMSMPMMTQALIQSFADRRIPTLLDNPYATFETDLSMIRQVQQTLGSIFTGAGAGAGAGLSAALLSGAQRQQGTDADISSARKAYEAFLNSDSSLDRPSSISPREYSSSTDSAEAQVLDMMQSSRSHEYQHHSPGLGDSSSSSAPMEGSFSGEYHADRFHQFLSQNGRNRAEIGSVIKELASSALATNDSRSQQTVLRKHSSVGSSLPGTPSSVIRTAPPRQVDTSPRGILQHSSSFEAQQTRADNCGTKTGWNGGEIQTPVTANGGVSTITVSGSAQSQSFNNEGFSDDD